MIDGIGKGGNGRIESNRGAPGQNAPVDFRSRLAGGNDNQVSVGAFAADVASAGAPVDSGKIAAIKQAIAEGRYPVDANRIAEAMLALDLP